MRALIFDLDGTLVDTVYEHVLAWQDALRSAGLTVPSSWLHRHIGMGSDLLIPAIARRAGVRISARRASELVEHQARRFKQLAPKPQALPGGVGILHELRATGVAHAIATSGRRPGINPSLDALDLRSDTIVIDRSKVAASKPEPDLVLMCMRQLDVQPADC